MIVEQGVPRVLVGPRVLEERICRLVYVRETDEAWTEAWSGSGWTRASVLVRHVIKAPPATPRALLQAGVPRELGEWDREAVCA